MTTKLTLCEVCHHPIGKDDKMRIIRDTRIHATDDCLYLYTLKAEKTYSKGPRFNRNKKESL